MADLQMILHADIKTTVEIYAGADFALIQIKVITLYIKGQTTCGGERQLWITSPDRVPAVMPVPPTSLSRGYCPKTGGLLRC